MKTIFALFVLAVSCLALNGCGEPAAEQGVQAPDNSSLKFDDPKNTETGKKMREGMGAAAPTSE